MAENSTVSQDLTEIQIELDTLRADNERLREEASQRGGWLRSVVTWGLIVLATLGILLSSGAVWLARTLLDTETYVETVEPLPRVEAVASAAAQGVVDQALPQEQVQEQVASLLPSQLAFLAVPVASGVRDVATEGATRFIQSDLFVGVWREQHRLAHQAAMVVLRGTDGGAIRAEGGAVILDLGMIVDSVLDDLGDLGTAITQVADPPEDAGVIVLYEDEQLAVAQSVVAMVDRFRWILPLVTLGLIGAAIWVARSRRKVIAYLGLGTSLGMAVSLVLLDLSRSSLAETRPDETSQQAVIAAWDTLLRGLYQQTWALLTVGLLIAGAAWLIGPSARAGRAMDWIQGVIARWRGDRPETPQSGFALFLSENKRTIQGLTVVAAFVAFLLIPSPSIGWVLVLVVLLAAALVLTEILAGPTRSEPGTAS